MIRPARAGDRGPLAALRAARRGTAEEGAAWATRLLAREADSARGDRLLVAEVGGTVVGYGVVTRFDPEADAPMKVAPSGSYLAGLMVDAAHRRRGVGSALVAARLAWIFEHAEQAFYFADDVNLATIELHRPFGFQALTHEFWFPGLSDPETPMTLYRALR